MRQQDKKHKTRDRILSAAAQIFSEVGFSGARVDEIAARAGVNKAAIYYHIGDKRALYQAVLGDIIRVAADRIARQLKTAPSPEEKLAVYIRTLTQRAAENPHFPRIMMREVAAGGRHFPEAFIADFIRLMDLLSGILEEGEKCNVFLKTEPMLIHFMVVGTFVFSQTGSGLASQYLAEKKIDPLRMPPVPDNLGGKIEKLVINAVKRTQSEDLTA